MKQDAVGLPARLRDSLAREPEIDSATGSVTEREAGQHAIARDGMQVPCDAMPYVVEPRRRSLTDAVRVVAMPAAAGMATTRTASVSERRRGSTTYGMASHGTCMPSRAIAC